MLGTFMYPPFSAMRFQSLSSLLKLMSLSVSGTITSPNPFILSKYWFAGVWYVLKYCASVCASNLLNRDIEYILYFFGCLCVQVRNYGRPWDCNRRRSRLRHHHYAGPLLLTGMSLDDRNVISSNDLVVAEPATAAGSQSPCQSFFSPYFVVADVLR